MASRLGWPSAVVVALSALTAAKLLYEDEESGLNGSHIGSSGVQRVRLQRSGVSADAASESSIALAHDLRGLVKEADERFAMKTLRICTADGETVRTLENPDGSSCIGDAWRCVWDGSLLYVASVDEPCGPLRQAGAAKRRG
ncbi:hypothetical protein AB1Y20_009369 [Prymnesium parvum]|uniref:Uncharacterized protein n=1 Tax=Prymnesium parvum TaxID=97485 RepID=A0AB34K3Z1_PRYPA